MAYQLRGWYLKHVQSMDAGLACHLRNIRFDPANGDCPTLPPPPCSGQVDGAGEIGVISSVTRSFCGECGRARLSADGKLYTCLLAGVGHDLKTPLRNEAGDSELISQIAHVWSDRHRAEMSYIGG